MLIFLSIAFGNKLRDEKITTQIEERKHMKVNVNVMASGAIPLLIILGFSTTISGAAMDSIFGFGISGVTIIGIVMLVIGILLVIVDTMSKSNLI